MGTDLLRRIRRTAEQASSRKGNWRVGSLAQAAFRHPRSRHFAQSEAPESAVDDSHSRAWFRTGNIGRHRVNSSTPTDSCKRKLKSEIWKASLNPVQNAGVPIC